MVSDVIYAATHSEIKYSTYKNNATADSDVKFVSDFESAYYIRLSVEDKAGTLSKISNVFGKNGVSIVEIAQKAKNADETRVPLIVITHKTHEQAIKNAVAKINASEVGSVEAVIRVEG